MRIAVAGGDLRMLTVARLLKASGNECIKLALGENQSLKTDALRRCDAVILPLPCIKGGYLNAPMSHDKINIDDIFELCGKDTLFLGGGLPFTDETHIDYSKREELLLKNAVPTAEGAVAIAMAELNTVLNGTSALVLGYGRIGNYLSEILKGLNCKVTVAARRASARALAEMSGYRACTFEDADIFSSADVIFNTVPFTVLGKNELALIKRGVAIIDLASHPGGTDADEAQKAGIKVINALSLPGKYAPETAGRIIFDTVVSIMRERGMPI
jgi:dipicolinate synthase subunit A